MMNTWDSLIDKLQQLNNIAEKIQTFDEDGNPVSGLEYHEINEFISNYLTWYSESLALLPEDLRERFRQEYEQSIKDFLIDHTSIATSEYGYKYFRYNYSFYFYKPFFTQRQILLEASKREPRAKTSETIF